ncbi:hypothetical protein VTO58DRAFT_103234 [Aureobasidium pullulans]
MRNRILISAFADEKLSQEEDQVHDALPKTVVQHLVSRTIPNDDNSGYASVVILRNELNTITGQREGMRGIIDPARFVAYFASGLGEID